jgi:Ca2+-transporting ATPase
MMVEKKINWHNISHKKAAEILRSDSEKGLSEHEAAIRQTKTGKNRLSEEKPVSRVKIFLEQFSSPLIYILIFAGIVTLFLKEYADAIVIFAAVFLNAIVGYIQESKSSKALRELKKVLSLKAIVVRNGKEREILADDLVPGDIILLKPGDKVPVDGRLLENHGLKINESALTGEWLPASKNAATIPENTPLADRDNLVYMGTIVEDGRGKFVATGTGNETEIGKISNMVRETKEDKTPYQKKLAHFSKIIGIAVGIICFIIFVEGMLTGGEFVEMFTTAVAIAVASIPEGLPVAMTVILALGMQRILKKKGLVRKLAAAETLGSTSVIATDKTGTLTKGKMNVAGIFTFSLPEEKVLKVAILCSEAFVENPQDQPEKWEIRGMPTERALVLEGAKSGLVKEEMEDDEPEIDVISFCSECKYSASLRRMHKARSRRQFLLADEEKNIIYAKGAPEVILEKSKYLEFNGKLEAIDKGKKDLLYKKYEELTGKGYRVLAAAYKGARESDVAAGDFKKSVNGLVFAGLIFLEDPVREEAKEAIQTCYRAGMRPIIITGDHGLTAKAIANKLGIDVGSENIMEGKDLEKMSEAEFAAKIKNIRIYARVEPKHKLRIIKAWQKKGEVVAMTGDGINDAPALKQANIGVALGSGTEVAKEVADIVLLTDDFSIIVAAVEEGRAILDNIRKIITYLLSDSFTEIVLIGSSMLAGLPLPVTAVQILWINLIEDGLPNVALAFEPKENDLMSQKPQGLNIPLLTREMKIIIFVVGLLTDLLLLGLFFWLVGKNYDIKYIQTMVFAGLAIDSIFYVFCCKSLRKNLWHTNIFNNKLLIVAWFAGLAGLLSAVYFPALNKLLGTVPLPGFSWLIIIGLAILNVVLIEAAKYYFIAGHKTEKI